jgi:hypothetical protein
MKWNKVRVKERMANPGKKGGKLDGVDDRL